MAKQQTNQQQVKATSRQSGWGYTTVASTTSVTNVAVTFPTPFAAPPKVILGLLGWKSGAAPTAITDFNGDYGASFSTAVFATNITATGFTARINSGNGNAFGGGSYNGFNWIAEA